MTYMVRPFDIETDYAFVWQLHIKENMAYIERHIGASLETVKGWFEKNIARQKTYIILNDGQPIGCYSLFEDDHHIKLSRFFLIDAYQGRGIGSTLFADILKDNLSDKDFLISVWEDNPVQDFWIKMGFVYVSTDDDKLMTMKYVGQKL